jgi:hypothetical protein
MNQNGLKYFQYELEILHEHVAPVPLAIRRRNQQQRRPSSEDFLEAMEAGATKISQVKISQVKVSQ